MKTTLKILIYVCLSVAGLFLIVAIGGFAWTRWQYYLPSDQQARQQFDSHRTDFIRFASILRQEPTATLIDSNGVVDADTNHARTVSEYRDLMRRTNTKEVYIRPDGSMEFQIWGFGCRPCSDSFKGLRFQPEDGHPQYPYGGAPIVVNSLADESLPKNKAAVADGLYVIPVDREWSIYRFEISD